MVTGVFPWSGLTADQKRVLGLVLGETPGLLVSVSLIELSVKRIPG